MASLLHVSVAKHLPARLRVSTATGASRQKTVPTSKFGSKPFLGGRLEGFVRLPNSGPGRFQHHVRAEGTNGAAKAGPGSEPASFDPNGLYYLPVVEHIPHLKEYLEGIEERESPLKYDPAFAHIKDFFVSPTTTVAKAVLHEDNQPVDPVHYPLAGPREKIVFDPEEVKACIVTCGGLCPGLNTVIRELVCALWFQYGVRDVKGIMGGYRGFYASNWQTLNPKVVDDIHMRGGTILGSSRGGHDTIRIVDSLESRGVNQVYIIGGDGTQRGAMKIQEECQRRGLKISVTGVPKTVDNDVAIIDRSFGFDTAVEAAQAAIQAAHVEAESAPGGVGLVKLMGRYAGHIAMSATLASRDVDCCLIPEVPFYVEGKGGLLEFLEARLKQNGHCVIVVAEGAGQEILGPVQSKDEPTDPSGNRLLKDIGLFLKEHITAYFKIKHPKAPFTLKYIDPTYMVRAIPSNASDTQYCTVLAHCAVHGAMAGYTGFVIGLVNNQYCWIPMERVTDTNNYVNVDSRSWAWVRSVNHQPDFSHRPQPSTQGRVSSAYAEKV